MHLPTAQSFHSESQKSGPLFKLRLQAGQEYHLKDREQILSHV